MFLKNKCVALAPSLIYVFVDVLLKSYRMDEALWEDARRRQCTELQRLDLLSHPVVLRDLEIAKMPTCFGLR